MPNPTEDGRGSYFDVLTRAVNDFIEHGYDDSERLAYWQRLLREAAERTFKSAEEAQRSMRAAMEQVFKRSVDNGGALKFHPGVSRFTLERLKPQLRALLDTRIRASADLIRLHKEEAVARTLRRFAGWATSQPAGGGGAGVDRVQEKQAQRKALTQLPFEERRLMIDQGAKLASSINAVIAQGTGAIAAQWHSQWRRPGYNYRHSHKERDGRVYLIRDSWAEERGLVKLGGAGYLDKVTQPGEEPYCSCYVTWFNSLRQLPDDMITDKGRAELAAARAKIAEMRSQR